MKKLFFCIIAAILIAIAAINLNLNSGKSALSDLTLANIEALARNEGGDGGIALMDCYGAFSNTVAPVWYNSCSKVGSGGVYYECGAITNYEPLSFSIYSKCYVYMK